MRGTADFDVVVAGAGSAGCAVAARLCDQTSLRVCLVEAGPDYGPAAAGRWPPDLLDARRFPSSHDWGFVAERPDGALPEPRAKVIGGCSTHNQCAAAWGFPGDYDGWASSTDAAEWRYDAIRPLIDQIENAHGGDPSHRGRNGALETRPWDREELASWQRAFLEGAEHARWPQLGDLSAPEPADGWCSFHANVRNGLRWNAAFAFLDRVRHRETLRILEHTLVDRLLFGGPAARALLCRTPTGMLELRARAFVLAAGTYGSPSILLRSGIGPAGELERLGIEPVADVAGVGSNLHDHPGVAIRLAPTQLGNRSVDEDLASGRFHQSQAVLRAADATLHVLPYQAPLDDGSWSFHLLAFAMTPRSRGTVSLRSRDPADPPRIDFRFLSDAAGADLALLRVGADVMLALTKTPPIALRARPLADVEEAVAADTDGYIAANVTGYAHAAGTCRIGATGDPEAVAEGSGLVRGTANVSVADASLIPVIPRANTNLTAMLIGWHVAGAIARTLG